jgi:hypothetical protein
MTALSVTFCLASLISSGSVTPLRPPVARPDHLIARLLDAQALAYDVQHDDLHGAEKRRPCRIAAALFVGQVDSGTQGSARYLEVTQCNTLHCCCRRPTHS